MLKITKLEDKSNLYTAIWVKCIKLYIKKDICKEMHY